MYILISADLFGGRWGETGLQQQAGAMLAISIVILILIRISQRKRKYITMERFIAFYGMQAGFLQASRLQATNQSGFDREKVRTGE